MSDKAEYYQLKGMVSEMSAEDQALVASAEAEVIAIAKQSDKAMIGAIMAMIRMTFET